MKRSRLAVAVLLVTTVAASPAFAHEDGRPHVHTAGGVVNLVPAPVPAAPTTRLPYAPLVVSGAVGLLLAASRLLRPRERLRTA